MTSKISQPRAQVHEVADSKLYVYDQMVHLVHDTNGGRQSYQASWMSRWMRKSCNMTGELLDYSSNASGNDLNHITKDILVASRPVKGLGVIKTVASDIVDGSQRPHTQRLRNERSCGYLFKDGRVNDDKGTSAYEIGPKFECGKAIYQRNDIQFHPVLHGIPAANDTSFRGCHFLDAVTSKNNRLDHAEAMKISTTLGSIEGEFSQRSNIHLFTVNSGASLLKECDVPATRRVVTQIKRNILGDLHRLSPFSGQGLEPLTCSADSEGRGNAGDIKTSNLTLNKVSAAETDTMDMNFSEVTNPLLGGYSASSDKVLWAFHTETNSDSSSAKTPGLELEIPMEDADQTYKQKSNIYTDNSPEAEPGHRWVKRLKLSSFHSSAGGKKSIKLAENSSRKRNNFFSRILKSDLTRSEATLRIHHGEESMAADKNINLSKKNLGNDSSLSHVWIQRWLRDGSSTRKKAYTMVDCEPQSLKWALEDLQTDRSPSIRAMAMMGKAMKSFQPCQLEKTGSLTTWNTKDV